MNNTRLTFTIYVDIPEIEQFLFEFFKEVKFLSRTLPWDKLCGELPDIFLEKKKGIEPLSDFLAFKMESNLDISQIAIDLKNGKTAAIIEKVNADSKWRANSKRQAIYGRSDSKVAHWTPSPDEEMDLSQVEKFVDGLTVVNVDGTKKTHSLSDILNEFLHCCKRYVIPYDYLIVNIPPIAAGDNLNLPTGLLVGKVSIKQATLSNEIESSKNILAFGYTDDSSTSSASGIEEVDLFDNNGEWTLYLSGPSFKTTTLGGTLLIRYQTL